MGKTRKGAKKAWRKIDTTDISEKLIQVNNDESRVEAATKLADTQLFQVDVQEKAPAKGTDPDKFKFRKHKKWRNKPDLLEQSLQPDPLVRPVATDNTPKTVDEKSKSKKKQKDGKKKKAATQLKTVEEAEKPVSEAEKQEKLRLAKAAPKTDLFQQFRIGSKFDKIVPEKLLDNVPEHVAVTEKEKAKRIHIKGKRTRQQFYDLWESEDPMAYLQRPKVEEKSFVKPEAVKMADKKKITVAELLAKESLNEPKKKKRKNNNAESSAVVVAPTESMLVDITKTESELEAKRELATELKRKLKQKKTELVQNKLSIPHPGLSYMPEEKQHKNAVMSAYNVELGLIRKKQKLMKSMSYPAELDAIKGDDIEDGLKVAEQPDVPEPEQLANPAAKDTPFKTPKERRREKRKEKQQRKELRNALRKARRKQDQVARALEDIDKFKQEQEEKAAKMVEQVSNQLKRVEKKALSSVHTVDVLTSDELPSNLRTLQPSSFALWNDRMRSLHNRSLASFKSLKHKRVDGIIV